LDWILLEMRLRRLALLERNQRLSRILLRLQD